MGCKRMYMSSDKDVSQLWSCAIWQMRFLLELASAPPHPRGGDGQGGDEALDT